MYSARSDPACDEYSHGTRSRASSDVSTAEGNFLALRLDVSPHTTAIDNTSYPSSRPPSSQGLPSPSYLSPSLSETAGVPPQPISHAVAPFRLLPDEDFLSDWFSHQTSQQGTPILRLEPAEPVHQPASCSSPSLVPQPSSTMSTAALQYESASDMANRSPFSWQVIESSNGLLDNDLGAYATDLTFPSSTGQGSAVASPPRGPLTAEQRELKRQRDLARRDSKRAVRTRRTDSGSSYMPSPPGTLPDMAGSPSAMPVYSTAPAQISLLADPPSTLPSQPYLNPYSAPVGDQGQTDLFPNPYAPPSYISVDYPPNYPVSSAPSLSTNYGTQTMPDPNLIYQPPMSLGASSVGSQEGHVRVVQARPKPQCWEHGCNGRQFSTFSNLLRHQREKSGQAAKATCPNCGAEFTRTTARNGHLLHDKCKQKKTSTTSGSSNNSRANSRS